MRISLSFFPLTFHARAYLRSRIGIGCTLGTRMPWTRGRFSLPRTLIPTNRLLLGYIRRTLSDLGIHFKQPPMIPSCSELYLISPNDAMPSLSDVSVYLICLVYFLFPSLHVLTDEPLFGRRTLILASIRALSRTLATSWYPRSPPPPERPIPPSATPHRLTQQHHVSRL